MCVSQIFGRGIASKKFKLITDLYPNIINIFKNEGKDHVIKLINAINGFDVKTTNKIVDSMDNFIEYYKKLIKIKPNVISTTNESTQNECTQQNELTNSNYSANIKKYIGHTIVFTGFRDKFLQSDLEKIGINFSDSVSKNTKLVVASNINENSNKLTKAKNLNIPIISKENFINSIYK
jgi:NAD-dependent DNA ligase